jgi:ribonuclease BN (tRNA processing enzyme)
VPLVTTPSAFGILAAPQMRIRLLGTGGAANELRHQASLLVEWGGGSDAGRILLDTGSGLDIVRLLIASGCDPTTVSDIFVSHQHSDHVGGLEPLLLWTILATLGRHGRPPDDETRVYADQRILAQIEQLLGAVGSAVPRLFGGKLRWVRAVDEEPSKLSGGATLTTFFVDHQPRDGGAMGCVVGRDGLRLVYSGDTRPTNRLIEAARGADVLVHEAGGLDAEAAEIHRQGHSTAGDAGRVAAAAGVGRLILTHVPAEGLTESLLAEARTEFGGRVDLATDRTSIEL